MYCRVVLVHLSVHHALTSNNATASFTLRLRSSGRVARKEVGCANIPSHSSSSSSSSTTTTSPSPPCAWRQTSSALSPPRSSRSESCRQTASRSTNARFVICINHTIYALERQFICIMIPFCWQTSPSNDAFLVVKQPDKDMSARKYNLSTVCVPVFVVLVFVLRFNWLYKLFSIHCRLFRFISLLFFTHHSRSWFEWFFRQFVLRSVSCSVAVV